MALRKTQVKTTETFKKEVYSLVGDEYTVMSEYTKAKEDVTFLHKTCGKTSSIKPDKFLRRNKRCDHCSNIKKWNTELFKAHVIKVTDGSYSVLSEYTKMHAKVTFLHKDCGRTYKAEANSFIRGHRCPLCANDTRVAHRKMSAEDFAERVREIHNGEYSILSKYRKSTEKIDIKHLVCGTSFSIRASSLLQGQGCHKCARERTLSSVKHTHEMFVAYVNEHGKGDYSVASEYQGVDSDIELLHKSCGNRYKTRPSYFKAGNRCPICAQSRGAVLVHKYLDSIGYVFKTEFSFEDCVNIQRLRFDFCVFRDDGEIGFLVEYDGKQHFEVVEYFGKDSFIRTQESDRIKNDYCESKGIPLIRIPYWEFEKGTLEEFLDAQIKSLKIAN